MFDDEPRDPGLDHLLNVFKDASHYDLRVSMPGQIVEYDETQCRATVQPLIQDSVIKQGTRTPISLPVIHDVPVIFWGGGGARTTYPVQVGDTCQIWFSSSSLDQWLTRGGEVDPRDDRRHDLNDAVCAVGLHDFAHSPTPAPTDATVIWPGAGDVRIGGYAGAESAIKGDSFSAALKTFLTALNTYAVGIQAIADPTNALTPVLAAAINVMKAVADSSLAAKAKVV